jgi:RNA polymerase sigma-70 factor (ECF subfamily)
MELSALIERCRAGDDLAWEALVRRFQGRIYGLALFYLGNAEEARDCAQEVFVRIYRRFDSITNDETFVPWMIQIARNAAIDRLRRMRVRPSLHAVSIDDVGDLVSRDPDPAEDLHRKRRRALVHTALEKLSRINREIVILKEIQGLSLERIASILDLPLGTVKSRSHRARIELAREVIALSPEEGPNPQAGNLP